MPDSVDDQAGRVVGLPRGVRALALAMEPAEGRVSLPELRRVADGLSDLQRFAQGRFGLVPLAAVERDLALEAPALDEILPRRRSRGQFEALIGELARLVGVAAR